MPNLQALFFVAVVAMLALVFGAPAEREVLEQPQSKETLKTANSYGYGYGYGLYGGYPYGYGYQGLYGWGKQTGTGFCVENMKCYMSAFCYSTVI
jgi:hypothetical protein